MACGSTCLLVVGAAGTIGPDAGMVCGALAEAPQVGVCEEVVSG